MPNIFSSKTINLEVIINNADDINNGYDEPINKDKTKKTVLSFTLRTAFFITQLLTLKQGEQETLCVCDTYNGDHKKS